MDQISYGFEMAVNEGQLEAFKEKAAGYIQAVKDGEPGTLHYQWWLEEDGNRCVVHETFQDSDAMMAHLSNVGPSLPELLALAPITRFEVFGDVSEQGRAALAELGVKHFTHLGGFSR